MPPLSTASLDVNALTGSVTDAAHGAVVTFVGYVRDHHAGRAVVGLEYSAYESMATTAIETVVARAASEHGARVAVQHRLGPLQVGEIAVVVVAAAAHRDAAFAACRWAIDEVKRTVPIWKRERYADGTEAWVDPTAPTGTVSVGGG